MLSHEEMVKKMMEDPLVKAEYELLQPEYALFEELLQARKRAGLTQAEVAVRMGTQTPAVARLEAGGGTKRHSPSIETLKKYADAVGCNIVIKLVPRPSA